MKAKRLMALLLCLLTVIGIIPAGTAFGSRKHRHNRIPDQQRV